MSRKDRVESLIKRELAGLLMRIGHRSLSLMSIISVELSSDLSSAKVYYSLFGPEADVDRTQNYLRKSAGYIKGELGKAIHLKHIPNLRFYYDNSLEKGDELIQKIDSLGPSS